MVVTRGLLLKGLGVCALCAGGTTVYFKWGEIKGVFSPSSNQQKKKINIAGLECNEPTEQEGGECTIKEKILVKKADGSRLQLTNLVEEPGKIKVYKVAKEGDQGYKDGFKFLIEEGDIGIEENNKLEEFETYEVKKGEASDGEGLKDKYFFSQKTDSKTEIKNSLGLPWPLPESASEEHQNITNENVSSIEFSGRPASLAGENVTLTISKGAKKTEYPLGYKFTFKNTSDTAATLTIGDEAITLKQDSPIDYDFKIKKNGSSLSLEKAWSLETFAKKVGLVKDGDFWDVGTTGLNIKVNDTTKKINKTKKPESKGKIKVNEGQGGYNGGFRLTIENDDLNLNDEKNSTITLGQFQSYEIVKDGENLYLFKKEEAKEGIKNALGLSCEFQEGQDECSLTEQNIKTIRFKGGAATLSGGTVTLNISTDSSGSEYPLGYRFTLKNTAETDSTLTIGGKAIALKQNSPVDFKIKKEESSLTLEKAWTLETLASKVGLVKESGDLWNVGTEGLNVNLEGTKKIKKIKYGTPSGRIKVYSDQKGYSEGLRFTVEKGDLDLREERDKNNTFSLGQFQSYEIVKDSDGTWYLSRKEGDQSRIKNALGLKCELPTSESSTQCTLTSENIGTIKFEGAGQVTASITGNPKLTIAKEDYRSLYPLGYKFTFTADSSSTITIPSSSGSLTLKRGLSIDYKIKKSETNNEILTLEKAWTADDLIFQAALKMNGNTDAWTVGSSNVAIKQGSNKSDNLTVQGKDGAKIRVYEGTPGYNQGMKFVVEEGDTSLTGGKGINKLTKYETYEVSVDSDDNSYYFTKKLGLPDSMREILGLPSTCSFPTNAGSPTECSLSVDELDEVKFKDKGTGSVTITASGTKVKLKISKESTGSYPLGYKFTFEQGSFTIPKSDGSITVSESSNNQFKIKEAGGKSTLESTGN